MYNITCPYCKHENLLWEVDGGINKYIPHECEECKKIFYILQRSWFDVTYDNHNVEVRKKEWFKNKKNMKIVGHAFKEKIPVYQASDFYHQFGGQQAWFDKNEEYWGKGK